jgi:hypothetical protein
VPSHSNVARLILPIPCIIHAAEQAPVGAPLIDQHISVAAVIPFAPATPIRSRTPVALTVIGFWRDLCTGGDGSSLARRILTLTRPYISRLRVLSRLFCPSTWQLDHFVVNPFRPAAKSFCSRRRRLACHKTGTLRRFTGLGLDGQTASSLPNPTRKPVASGNSDLLATWVLRSNWPQPDLRTNPARTELRSARHRGSPVVLTDKPGHSTRRLRQIYRWGQPPRIHLPLAAGIFMLDKCSLSPRKRLPRSARRSIVVANSQLPSNCVAGFLASATMSRPGGVPEPSWDGDR